MKNFLIHSIILKLLPIYDLHNLVAVRRIFWQNVAVVVQVQVVLHAQNGGEFDRPHHHSILASSHLPSYLLLSYLLHHHPGVVLCFMAIVAV